MLPVAIHIRRLSPKEATTERESKVFAALHNSDCRKNIKNNTFFILFLIFNCTSTFNFLPFFIIFFINAEEFCYLPIAYNEDFFHGKV